MILHWDVDSVIYAAGFASEKVEKKEGGLIEVRPEPLANCLQIVKTILGNATKTLEHDTVCYYLSGKTNFRNDIVDDYKANRVGTRKPYWYQEMRDYVEKYYQATITTEGLEADDLISIMQAKDPANTTSITIDKDFNTFEGWKYNWQKKELFWVSKEEALKFFYKQVLMGDKVDNIQGLPYCSKETIEKYGLHHSAKKGCGEKSAALILAGLSTEDELYAACLGAYTSYGDTLEPEVEYDALASLRTQGQLLHMVRELDEDGKPVMWQPPISKEKADEEERIYSEREAVA